MKASIPPDGGDGTRWYSLPNGTAVSVVDDAGGAIVAAVLASDRGSELLIKAGDGRPFVSEGFFSDFDDAVDHWLEILPTLRAGADPVELVPDYPFEFAFNTDSDADSWMRSDDPVSRECTVTVTWHRSDGSTDKSTENSGGSAFLPALNYHRPLSAWFVGDACRVEITDPAGNVTVVRTCTHADQGPPAE